MKRHPFDLRLPEEHVNQAAVEAAARVLNLTHDSVIRDALEQAMPEIRKQIKHELEAALCTDPECQEHSIAEAIEIVINGWEP
jgi:hypothetical protein